MDTLREKPNFLNRIKNQWKRILLYALAVFFSFWLIGLFANHSVDLKQLSVATVKRGNLISQIEGSGTVKVAGLISFYSPIDSYIKEVYKREGHSVLKGDTILSIDDSELDKSILEIENKIRITENNLTTKEIDFEVLQIVNKKNEEMFATNQEKNHYELEVAKKLHEIGAIAQGNVLAKAAELKIDKINLKYLKQTQDLQQKKLKQEINTLRLNAEISQNEYEFLLKLKKQTILLAEEDGIISKQPFFSGEKLQKGQLIAQMSNLKNFRVETQISQRQIEEIQLGQLATIRINDKEYQGELTLLQPEIKNGYGIAEIMFKEGQDLTFKQNQNAQVFIQTGFKENVLVVERGAFLASGGRTAFRVQGNRAKRVSISSGNRNYELVEIVSGLDEGDQIIVSQIASFMEWNEFKIN